MKFSKYTFALVNSRSGVGVCLKKVGSRFRSAKEKRNQVRLPVTLGDTKTVTQSRLRCPVPGYVWLRKSVTQPGSRLRMVT